MYRNSLLCLLSLLFFSSLEALEPKPFPSQEEADCYLTNHYNLACNYYNNSDWRQAYDEFEKVIYFFPGSPEAAASYYYLGVCFYSIQEYDFANEAFSNYLKSSSLPPYFEDAVYYKYSIAEIFKHGRRRHPFHNRYLPRITSGKDLALQIYDEIVVALPNHPLAVSALFAKADLLIDMKEYRKGIDTYQLLIRRFPDDEKVPESYFRIAHAYYLQSKVDCQNPDIYGLAELNLKKFEIEFPRDERVCKSKEILIGTRENFAAGYSRLAGFYARIGHPEAAEIYYKTAIERYPDTLVADYCRAKLAESTFVSDEEELCEADESVIEENQNEQGENDLQGEVITSPVESGTGLQETLSFDDNKKEDLAQAAPQSLIPHPSYQTLYEEEIALADPFYTRSEDFEPLFDEQKEQLPHGDSSPLVDASSVRQQAEGVSSNEKADFDFTFYEEPSIDPEPFYAEPASTQIGDDKGRDVESPTSEAREEEVYAADGKFLNQEAYEATFYEEPLYEEFTFQQPACEEPACKQTVYEESISDESAVYLHYSLLKKRDKQRRSSCSD